MVMPTQELSLDAIALVGPTASGKTAAALAIAKQLERTHQLPVEIISMDSALVYRGMDIGTAKPEAHELEQVPHHLIDIIEPTQAYSAADFERDATRLIRDIRARGKLPLVVGGTMLYLKALRDGLNDLPQAQPAVREAIEQQALAQGWPALHAELAAVDPITAARLSPNDAQRISRALEIWRISGKALSAWFEESSLQRDASQAALRMPLLSLEPSDRAWLHARIAQRFDAMLTQGFMQEMHSLRARGDLSLSLPSMRCVGYRQAWEILDLATQQGVSVNSLMPQLRELSIVATRQLAKRQFTWLRGFTQRQVIACDAPDALQATVRAAEALIAKGL
jgi:tRNA dimethylallyltransferase